MHASFVIRNICLFFFHYAHLCEYISMYACMHFCIRVNLHVHACVSLFVRVHLQPSLRGNRNFPELGINHLCAACVRQTSAIYRPPLLSPSPIPCAWPPSPVLSDGGHASRQTHLADGACLQ